MIDRYDPAALDLGLFEELFSRFADTAMLRHRENASEAIRGNYTATVTDRAELDDFAEGEITKPDDIVTTFAEQFFYGCEADDALNAVAFNRSVLPGGRPLNAMMGSDIGHWDVPDMRQVLVEAYELVERGHLAAAQFQQFTCTNLAQLLTGVNPSFFAGTAVEQDITSLLAD